MILINISNSSKLPSLIVFKGKIEGPFEKELQKSINIKNNLIYAKCK